MPKHGRREEVNTIIISDFHIGGKLLYDKVLRKALSRFKAKRYVLNGDAFDGSNFDRGHLPYASRPLGGTPRPPSLPHGHQKILKLFQRQRKRGYQVIDVTGNHDQGILQVIALIRREETICEEYEWEYQGKKFLAIHGDQFDLFYHKYKWTSEIATRIYEMIQSWGPQMRWFCAFVKGRSKHYTNAIDYVAQGATVHAAHRGVDHVFCGHTHHAEYRELNEVHYYNSGCWTQDPCSLITIGEKGIRIHYFNAQGEEIKIDGPYPI